MFAKFVIIAFLLLELSNVIALYFFPGSKMANAVGVFTAWDKSKLHPEIHDFIKYLVYWVAGAKLVFLLLLAVIIFFGSEEIQRYSLIALGAATLSFYWRMFPLIRRLDKSGQIQPRNYSMIIGGMIFVLISSFILAAFL